MSANRQSGAVRAARGATAPIREPARTVAATLPFRDCSTQLEPVITALEALGHDVRLDIARVRGATYGVSVTVAAGREGA